MLEVKAKVGAFSNKRFVQILQGVVNGLTYKAIAEENDLAEETIKEYAKHLREEFNAKTQSEVLAKAVARGMVTIRESKATKVIAFALIALQGVELDWHSHARQGSLKTRFHMERRIDEA